MIAFLIGESMRLIEKGFNLVDVNKIAIKEVDIKLVKVSNFSKNSQHTYVVCKETLRNCEGFDDICCFASGSRRFYYCLG